MRIRSFHLIAALGGLGLAATATLASAHAKPAHAPARGCPVRHVSAHGGRHVRHLHVAWRHGGWSAHHGMAMRHGWQGGHSWHEEHGWSDQHGWSEGDGRWAEAREHHWGGGEWGRRPWATDAFGYLTWPGKTHFASGQPVEGATPPPPPPPPEDMQGPPPQADENSETYIVRRF